MRPFIENRNRVARYYEKVLEPIREVSLFHVPVNIQHSYYKFPIRLADELDRDKLALLMKEKGIETGSVYYPPCHLQPYYLEHYSHKGEFPVAENVLKKVLCLPMHANLSTEELEYITGAFISALNEL